MILPIVTMIVFMPVMLIYTGWNSPENNSSYTFINRFFSTIEMVQAQLCSLFSIIFINY